MPSIERATSIRQPYCDQILRGIKKIEYRSRPTNIRARVYIYAALSPGHVEDWEECGKKPGDLPTGAIIGSVQMVDCRWNDSDGIYEWQLANPLGLETYLKPINQPQPGIWRPKFRERHGLAPK